MTRISKYPATVVGFSETKSGLTQYVKVAFYNPKSKHVNVEFLRPGFQIPKNVQWGDRGFVTYSGSLYNFAKA
jgi:hypothetical protein